MARPALQRWRTSGPWRRAPWNARLPALLCAGGYTARAVAPRCSRSATQGGCSWRRRSLCPSHSSRLCSFRSVASVPNRFYHWIRHPSAQSVADEQRTVSGFEHLRGHKYCLLVTHKRSGEGVPTPVWFGLADGNVYVRSEANVAKVKRVRNDPRVRIAPCTVRGKPVGPPAEGRARVLDEATAKERAEAALAANYGLGRKLYQGVGGAVGVTTVYLEITPA